MKNFAADFGEWGNCS